MYLTTLIIDLALVGLVLIAGRILYRELTSPIKHVPGPFLAKFTDLWRLLDFYNGTQITSHRKLHEQLGPAVRIGPNTVSLSDPALLKTIYSTRGEYLKSDFYSVNDAMQDGHRIQNVFSTRDKEFHQKYMRPIHKLFSLQHILSLEHLCSKTLVTLCRELESRFVDGGNAGTVFDLSKWIEYSAWDVVGEMTFGEALGFLQTGSDVKNLIHMSEGSQNYFGIVGQMPWIDMWLGKNPRCPIKFPTFAEFAGYCVERIMQRSASEKRSEVPADYLDHYIRAKELNPGVVTDNELIGYLMLNMLAGADTASILEKATVYHVLANPFVYGRLRAELDAAALSFPPTYDDLKDLPYLDAVIREGKRIHPVLSGILERIVPEGDGLILPDGRVIAPGTIVGMNAWVLHRDRDVYGQDVEAFRPERWLRHEFETAPAHEARVKRMRDTDFTFGGGSRVCVGRSFSQMEMLKTLATLFSRYDIELAPGVKQYNTKWSWFTFIDQIHVKLRRRDNVAPLKS